MSPAMRVLIAAGGTGGHVFPALAVAEELRRQGWHAEWVGTDRGLESRVIPPHGIGLHVLKFSGLRGKGLSAWIFLPFRLWRAFCDAREILSHARPQVVVAFGGYVTFPVGLAAKVLRLPLCIHEQNAVMGTANRWLARLAQSVMVSFPATRHAPLNAVVTGNPVRQSIVAIGRKSHAEDVSHSPIRLLVIGGSLGARAINRVLPEAVQIAQKRGFDFDVLHQTGEQDFAAVKADYEQRAVKAQCTAFIEQMQDAYDWAELLIGRAGASTVTEAACAARPAIFVPLPNAIDDHQTANARYLAQAQAAVLIPQSSLNALALADTLCSLSRPQLKDMGSRALGCAMPRAAQSAAQQVIAQVMGGALPRGAG